MRRHALLLTSLLLLAPVPALPAQELVERATFLPELGGMSAVGFCGLRRLSPCTPGERVVKSAPVGLCFRRLPPSAEIASAQLLSCRSGSTWPQLVLTSREVIDS